MIFGEGQVGTTDGRENDWLAFLVVINPLPTAQTAMLVIHPQWGQAIRKTLALEPCGILELSLNQEPAFKGRDGFFRLQVWFPGPGAAQLIMRRWRTFNAAPLLPAPQVLR